MHPMQAGQIALAAALIASGFGIGWEATEALLPTKPAPEQTPAVPDTPPVAIAQRQPEPEPEPDPAVETKPKRRTQPPAPTRSIEEPKHSSPLDAPEATMRALKASPHSVDRFAETYSAIKKASEALPAEKRSAVLATINAANLTGDVDGLEHGLELLRAGFLGRNP